MSVGLVTAAEPLPSEFRSVGVSENLGAQIPKDIRLIDQDGLSIGSDRLFNSGKPTVLVMAYYNCPMLCSMVVTGVVEAVNAIPLQIGDRYNVVVVSFDPSDTTGNAKRFSESYFKQIKGRHSKDGFRFLVGQEADVRRLADAIGFGYKFNEKTGEYAHNAAIFFIAPDATISRYLYGVEFKPSDFRLSILDASDRKQVSTAEKLLLYCYGYDSHTKGYSLVATNVMKLGGIVTIIVLGLSLVWLNFKYKDRKSHHG